jgi:hypothetical protein
MRVPRSWCLPQGKRASSQTGLTAGGTRPAPDQQASRLTWVQEDRRLAMPRWKRFVLMNVVPVCAAMVWQLSVVIGLLLGFFLGFTLLKRLLP